MARQAPPTGQLLVLGIAQAVAFFVGALLGRWLGLALGWDAFGSNGYDTPAMLGILLLGLGGGAGAQLARAWHRRRYGAPPP